MEAIHANKTFEDAHIISSAGKIKGGQFKASRSNVFLINLKSQFFLLSPACFLTGGVRSDRKHAESVPRDSCATAIGGNAVIKHFV